MSRNPQIEAIHEARYDLQTCAEQDKPAAREKLYALLQRAALRANPPIRPEEVLDALYEDYKEFRRTKHRQEWPKLGH
jgi:protein involved in polysaccharide export with SLBB domain